MIRASTAAPIAIHVTRDADDPSTSGGDALGPPYCGARGGGATDVGRGGATGVGRGDATGLGDC